MKEGYLVFDLGTGNSRVAIGDETGNIIGIRSFENIYHQESRNPEAKYFIPKEWLQKILLEMKILFIRFLSVYNTCSYSNKCTRRNCISRSEGQRFYRAA